ncbi:MAG: DUF4332 domain-containing protein [Trichodesmium sp.]
MIHNIQDLEGINSVYADKLIEVGISNIEELLEKCSSLEEIEKLEQTTGIEKKLIIEWIKYAGLIQIKGMNKEYFSLLSALGIHTISELKDRFPETLHSQMLKINRQQKLVERLPSLSMVRSWTAQAINIQRKTAHNNVPNTKLPQKKWSLDWSD